MLAKWSTMKKLARQLVSFFVLLTTGAAGAQSHTPSFSLAISTPHTTVRTGEPVLLKVLITNTSGREVYYAGALNRPGGLDVNVMDSNNKPVKETSYGQRQHGTAFPPVGSGSVLRIEVDPGKSMEEDVMVDKEWDIGTPGTYKLYVELADPQSNQAVRSNAVILTVMP
jgi:hypothetical protein